MGDHSETTDYSTGGTRRLVVVEFALIAALCFSLLGYVLAWVETEPLLGFPLVSISSSVTTMLGWLAFFVVVPAYVTYRFHVDWSFTGTQVSDTRGLAAFSTSSIIWVGIETLGIRSYGITIIALAALIIGLYKMTQTLWAVDEAMIRDATSDLFDR